MKAISDKEKEFLKGLDELTRRTGFAVAGCGCCGSPSLDEVDTSDLRSGYSYRFREVSPLIRDFEGEHIVDDICWLTPTDGKWDEYKDEIAAIRKAFKKEDL